VSGAFNRGIIFQVASISGARIISFLVGGTTAAVRPAFSHISLSDVLMNLLQFIPDFQQLLYVIR